MPALPDERQFYISLRIWHELSGKVDVNRMEKVLHASLDLSKYGADLKKYFYNFLLMPSSSQVLTPYAHYAPKNKLADISTAINYEKMFAASPRERLKMQEVAYLEGLDALAKKLKNRDFDVARLKEDVARIFAEENWWCLEGVGL
jgi:hypothetical protein